MSIKSEILKLASKLPIGSTIYVTCPKCFREKKLGITSTCEGLVYHCFSASCKLKGKLEVALSKEALLQQIILKALNVNVQKKFIVPEYFIEGWASEASVKLALQYNLMEAYRKGLYRTSYDPRLNRQVFYYTNDHNRIVGAVGRRLNNRDYPKAYVYPASDKPLWYIGTSDVCAIVEDIFSAVAVCNSGFVGCALSGTTLPFSDAERLGKHQTCIIALDKDATLQAFEIKKMLDIYCENVIILPLERDLKDTPVPEIRGTIISLLIN